MGNGLTQSAGPRVFVMPLLVTAAVVLMHCLPGADLDVDDWWAQWHMDKLLHLIAFGMWGLGLGDCLGQTTKASTGMASRTWIVGGRCDFRHGP